MSFCIPSRHIRQIPSLWLRDVLIVHWSEEIYWSFLGSVPFLGIPALAGRAQRDPDEFTEEELAGSLATSMVIGYAIGKVVPNFADFKTYKLLQTLKYGGLIGVPFAVASTASYHYEKTANERVREAAPGHSTANWFGPYASGFGTVV